MTSSSATPLTPPVFLCSEYLSQVAPKDESYPRRSYSCGLFALRCAASPLGSSGGTSPPFPTHSY